MGSLGDYEALVGAVEALPTVRLLELDAAPSLDEKTETSERKECEHIQQAISVRLPGCAAHAPPAPALPSLPAPSLPLRRQL